MTEDVRVIACLWHQRTAAIEARERLLATLAPAADRLLVETCHRVEVYAAVPAGLDPTAWLERALPVDGRERSSAQVLTDAAAVAHLFGVAAGLDSAVTGEPQILRQIRRAYLATSVPHPLLARLFERALHVAKEIRRTSGLASERSVGSLAVDETLRLVARPDAATVLVVGAGEMGKLAARALVRRVGHVLIANRDPDHARMAALASGATAIALAAIPAALDGVDAVISAADTRGAVLNAPALAPRAGRRPLVVVDIAVPRSVDADARALPGVVYRSVDDLPGAGAQAPEPLVRAARERCAREAERFVAERAPDSIAAIRTLRESAERVRTAKLERAFARLGHLSARDRRIVEALSTTITNALLHAPTVALRDRRADPATARRLFEDAPR